VKNYVKLFQSQGKRFAFSVGSNRFKEKSTVGEALGENTGQAGFFYVTKLCLLASEQCKLMKASSKFSLRAACHLLGGASCVGIVLLIAASVQAQNLFEADEYSGNIYEFAPSGARTTFASGLDYPIAVAFNSAGDLFVAPGSYGDNNIVEITPGGVRSIFASVSEPIALTFNSAGDLFVSEATGTIVKVTPGGAQSTFASLSGDSETLGFNSAGDLFAAEFNSHQIIEITPGGAQSDFTSVGGSPYALAFDNADDLFVGNGGSITEITPGGVQSTFASGLSGPVGLAFDSTGDLFASGYTTGYIYKFTPSGAQTTFASGLSSPVGLAFQPVPEPSVLGLLAVGVTPLLVRRQRNLI
jgi:glucose/arabinose dehydrogenase